jgi:hypothetical protein
VHRIGIPKKLINLARMTLTETFAKVKIENELGHSNLNIIVKFIHQ